MSDSKPEAPGTKRATTTKRVPKSAIGLQKPKTDIETYQALKDKLAADALGGDGRALETWLKTFGSQFVADDLTRVSDVQNLSDIELARQCLALLSTQSYNQLLEELNLVKKGKK